MTSSNETITKQQLAAEISAVAELTAKDAAAVIDMVLGEISQSLVSGEDVLISGFGRFVVQSKNPRQGRNPRNGDPVEIAARRVMRFKASEVLKKTINSKKLAVLMGV